MAELNITLRNQKIIPNNNNNNNNDNNNDNNNTWGQYSQKHKQQPPLNKTIVKRETY